MKKNELKQVLKPLIKECIKEVIFEEGILSGIITEVARGLAGSSQATPQLVSKAQSPRSPLKENNAIKEARQQLAETKKSLSESTGLKGIFEGIRPIHQPRNGNSNKYGVLREQDPTDPGVDISGIMKIAGGSWNQIK